MLSFSLPLSAELFETREDRTPGKEGKSPSDCFVFIFSLPGKCENGVIRKLIQQLKKCFSKTVLPNIRCKYLFCQILGQMLFISLLLGELLAASNNSALSHEEAGSPVPVQQLSCVIKTPDCFHPFSFLAYWFLVFVLLASWLQDGCHLPRHLIFTLGSQARRSKAKIISFQEALLFYSVLRPSTADFPLPLMVQKLVTN